MGKDLIIKDLVRNANNIENKYVQKLIIPSKFNFYVNVQTLTRNGRTWSIKTIRSRENLPSFYLCLLENELIIYIITLF